jgi:hypothetical protein
MLEKPKGRRLRNPLKPKRKPRLKKRKASPQIRRLKPSLSPLVNPVMESHGNHHGDCFFKVHKKSQTFHPIEPAPEKVGKDHRFSSMLFFFIPPSVKKNQPVHFTNKKM